MTSLEVDGRGITYGRAEAEALGSLDVLFDGRRVCSLSPARAVEADDGALRTPWPVGMLDHLTGRARVTLREHVSSRTVFEAEVAFTDSPARVAVVDADGEAVAFDKWGQPGRAFESADPALGRTLAELVADLLRDLREELALPSFMAYGTLLGAVREQRLIGHDFDADVAYLSGSWHPADVARESFAVQRRLVALGWRTERSCDSMYQIRVTRAAVEAPYIDIFPAYFHEGVFEIPPLARGALQPHQVLPLSTRTLEGVELPAPADPGAVLSATYGEGWRVPDPAFRFAMAPDYQRRISGWMGNHLARPGRWRRWHRENPGEGHEVTPFATWVRDRLEPGTSVLDVGCGTGADTVALAAATGFALGLDYAPEALDTARRRADAGAAPAQFQHCTLYDTRALLAHTLAVATRPGPRALYARLSIDALGSSGRRNLLLASRTLLRGGGRSYFEVRTAPGNPFPEERRAPWAGPPDMQSLTADIAARGGTIEHEETTEGPEPRLGARTRLLRIVTRW